MGSFEEAVSAIQFGEKVTGMEAADMLCRGFGRLSESELFRMMPELQSSQGVVLMDLSVHGTNTVSVVVDGQCLGRIFRLQPNMLPEIQLGKYDTRIDRVMI
mgnify:CR=1 FL=1